MRRWAARKCGQPATGFFVEAGAPFILLTDVGCTMRALRTVSGSDGTADEGRSEHDPGGAEDSGEGKPTSIIFEPDGAAEQDDQSGQSVGAEQGSEQQRRGDEERPRPDSTGSR